MVGGTSGSEPAAEREADTLCWIFFWSFIEAGTTAAGDDVGDPVNRIGIKLDGRESEVAKHSNDFWVTTEPVGGGGSRSWL